MLLLNLQPITCDNLTTTGPRLTLKIMLIVSLTTCLDSTTVPVLRRLMAAVLYHPKYHLLEIIPRLQFPQHPPRDRGSRRSANGQILLSMSSTRSTPEPLSRLQRSGLHSRRCSTCPHAAFKYGNTLPLTALYLNF